MKQSKISFLLLLILAICTVKIFAQVKIGEKYKDVTSNHVINYTGKSIKLSDFKNKLIILDFWSTSCSGCIAAFPKLDSLQRLYKDKMQIILVNSSSEDSTIKFFSKRKRIKMPDVPLITEDTILHKYFPHIWEPFEVWIDSSGMVSHFTSSEDLTLKNINDFIAHRALNPYERNDVHTDFDKPLFVQQNGMFLNKVDYYSYLMHYPGGNYDAGNHSGVNHIVRNAASISTLFRSAYAEGGKYDFSFRNTLVLNVADTSKYIESKDIIDFDQWEADNTYDYDLLVPTNKSAQLYEFMKQDLARYFDLKASVEKRMIKCWVLIRTSKIDKLHSNGEKPEINFFNKDHGDVLYLKNEPFARLVSKLAAVNKNRISMMPFIDETGYQGNINIALDADAVEYYDLPKLKMELKKYDLDLVEADHLRNILVISETKKIALK